MSVCQFPCLFYICMSLPLCLFTPWLPWVPLSTGLLLLHSPPPLPHLMSTVIPDVESHLQYLSSHLDSTPPFNLSSTPSHLFSTLPIRSFHYLLPPPLNLFSIPPSPHQTSPVSLIASLQNPQSYLSSTFLPHYISPAPHFTHYYNFPGPPLSSPPLHLCRTSRTPTPLHLSRTLHPDLITHLHGSLFYFSSTLATIRFLQDPLLPLNLCRTTLPPITPL